MATYELVRSLMRWWVRLWVVVAHYYAMVCPSCIALAKYEMSWPHICLRVYHLSCGDPLQVCSVTHKFAWHLYIVVPTLGLGFECAIWLRATEGTKSFLFGFCYHFILCYNFQMIYMRVRWWNCLFGFGFPCITYPCFILLRGSLKTLLVLNKKPFRALWIGFATYGMVGL